MGLFHVYSIASSPHISVMESQAVVNLIIPLASAVAVVLISSATSIWLKRLDVQQKKADHKQELSKLLLDKKLEAGEAFVTSVVVLINQLDSLRVLIITGMPSEEDDVYYSHLQKAFQELQILTSSLMTKERNAAYLYFDARILEQEVDSEIPHLIQLEKTLVGLITDKNAMERLLEEERADRHRSEGLLWSYKENSKQLSQTLEEYAEAILEHRGYLVRLCGMLREQLAKYDLPNLA